MTDRLDAHLCTSMDDVRREIDHIDREIVELLGRRRGYVLAASGFKTSEQAVRAPDRVATMLTDRREWAVSEGLDPDMIATLFERLVDHFIQLELAHWSEEN